MTPFVLIQGTRVNSGILSCQRVGSRRRNRVTTRCCKLTIESFGTASETFVSVLMPQKSGQLTSGGVPISQPSRNEGLQNVPNDDSDVLTKIPLTRCATDRRNINTTTAFQFLAWSRLPVMTRHLSFTPLTLCLQFVLAFLAIDRASAANSSTVVTTSGKLVGVDNGAGGTNYVNLCEA